MWLLFTSWRLSATPSASPFCSRRSFSTTLFLMHRHGSQQKKKCRVVTATQTTSPQPWPAGQCSKTKIHFFLLCSISVLVVFHNFTVVPLGIKVECVCQTDAHKHTCTKSWQSLWHHHSCLLSPNKLQNTIWTSAWLGFSTSYTGVEKRSLFDYVFCQCHWCRGKQLIWV